MISLAHALAAWGTPDFARVLKLEIERLPAAALPLQAGLSASSYVLDRDAITAMAIDAAAHGGSIRAKVGIFYSGIVGGCARGRPARGEREQRILRAADRYRPGQRERGGNFVERIIRFI